EKLERIVQAGRYTATGGNAQACRFIVVQENLSALKKMIWKGIETTNEPPVTIPADALTRLKNFINLRTQGTDFLFRDAPVVIYVAAESAVDASLAAQTMELAAIAQGLGVLYNGFLVYAANLNPAVHEWLDVQDKPLVVCMLVGYPRVTYQRTAPRRIADVRWR
ncbi:MAG: nitroreductase family protein, partial [Sporomusaceae bacterium]|nr:nitroreductase family protein [Sporomusaceae bacterium]